ARGRSERVNRMLQGRLVNELRVAGIHSLEAANRFLNERFLPAYNTEFARTAAQPESAFVALHGGRARGHPVPRGRALRGARQHRSAGASVCRSPNNPDAPP